MPKINPIINQHFPADAHDDILKSAAQGLRDFVKRNVPAGVKVRDIVAQGPICRETLGAAEKAGADLVVVASRKPAARDCLPGANAANVVRHCPRLVMAVRDR